MTAINCRSAAGSRGRPTGEVPPPEQPEACSMPSNERVRLHDGEDSTPVDQPRQGDECDAGRVIGPPRLDLALEVQRQLLTQEEVLGGELDVRPHHRRQESEDVASDARNRAHVEPRTGLRHAVGCYRRWGSSRLIAVTRTCCTIRFRRVE
jgi:hypothetical protein